MAEEEGNLAREKGMGIHKLITSWNLISKQWEEIKHFNKEMFNPPYTCIFCSWFKFHISNIKIGR